MSTFCRHNRFVAECPICSKGTVLDPNRTPERRPRPATVRRKGAKRPVQAASGLRVSRGEFASAGPYEDGREVRLEKVPGGLRLAIWQAGQLVKDAPVLALADLPALLRSAAEQGLLEPAELSHEGDPAIGAHGASPGRTGELADELRVERLDDDRLRIARWIMRPNRGWELQEAPVLLPADRFLRALGSAAGRGVLASGDPVE
ncbi:MAG TPA: hypothetical protein VM824_08690 [Thermoleophilaceae bacterium]|nr:hypothetical protein [Thermoleophilaceae bacterium]